MQIYHDIAFKNVNQEVRRVKKFKWGWELLFLWGCVSFFSTEFDLGLNGKT